MKFLAFVVMFAGLLFYFLTVEERINLLRACRTLFQRAARRAIDRWTRQPDETGHPPAPLPLATWSIVIVNAWVFARMIFAGGALGDPETLVSWGGSFGPRTTNGEWWRLVTATFVHTGPLHLGATLAGLIQAGCMTERLVGPFAFASIYLAAGALTNLVGLSRFPVSVATGGAGAVFGVYALLLATSIWGLLRGAPVRVPGRAAKRLVPGVAFFVLYTVASGGLDRVVAAVVLAGGGISGFLLAKGARDHKPAARRVAVVVADIAAIVMALAVPLRGMTDARPEISRVIAMEDRTTKLYDSAVVRSTRGAVPAAALVQMIDRTILPDLETTRVALGSLERVPPEHVPLVARAQEYLRLRTDSWRLRAEALRKSRMSLLKQADLKQWQALNVLTTLRDVQRQH